MVSSKTIQTERGGILGSTRGGRGGRSSTRLEEIPNHQIGLEACKAELEIFRVGTHNEVTAQGGNFKQIVRKRENLSL